ncbi:MAG TPA: hypothetical protein PKL53_03440 [Methylotenera sp.]|nr:hypothetical protein [Methylotenera sp.]
MLSKIFAIIPIWYIVITVFLSFYYGCRGVVGQRIAAKQLNQTLMKQELREWKCWEIVFIRYIQDFIFHVVCSIAGFFSLFMAFNFLQEIDTLSDIGSETAILLVFFLLLGLVGACGQLPHLLLEGRFPKGG